MINIFLNLALQVSTSEPNRPSYSSTKSNFLYFLPVRDIPNPIFDPDLLRLYQVFTMIQNESEFSGAS